MPPVKPAQIMTNEEIDHWLDFFRNARRSGEDVDGGCLQIEAWKVEGMVATIDHLRTVGDAICAAAEGEPKEA